MRHLHEQPGGRVTTAAQRMMAARYGLVTRGAGHYTHPPWELWAPAHGTCPSYPQAEGKGRLSRGRRPSEHRLRGMLPPRGTHHLSCSDERTTDTEEAAMAAEPIHGCSTMPMGMKTPGQGKDDTHATAQKRVFTLGCPL